MLKIQNQQIQQLIASMNVYASLFINSISEIRTERDRSDAKKSRNYYVVNYVSMEDMSVTGSRTAFETHSSDGESTQWKRELSPNVIRAMQKRMELTGELIEITGYKIAKIEYTRPYTVNGREVTKDTVVFACNDNEGTTDLERVMRERMEQHGLIDRAPASPAVA